MNIKNITTRRGKNRHDAIKSVGEFLLNSFKAGNQNRITREQIKNLICSPSIKKNANNRAVKLVIDFLINTQQISELIRKDVTANYYTNRSLRASNDYGSYELLISKNANKPKKQRGCFSLGNKSLTRDKKAITISYYIIN